MGLRQGEIYWARVMGSAGRRPVLVLTRTNILNRLTSVTIAPLTRTIRGIRSEVVLSPSDGVPTACVVSLDNIATIRQKSLGRHITELSKQKMQEVFEAIRFAFAMA